MHENVYGKDCWIGYGGDCFHTLANAIMQVWGILEVDLLSDLDDYSMKSKYKSVAYE